MAWWTNQIISDAGQYIKEDCPCCDCIQQTPGISLDAFFKEMCIQPFYGWQMSQNPNNRGYKDTPIPGAFDGGACNRLVYERCSRGCQIAGRQEICEAIIEAEQIFAEQAKFWPTPHQMCDEIAFPHGFKRGEIALNYGKVKALGTIAYDAIGTTILQDGDFLDTDGDGVLDTARTWVGIERHIDPDDVVMLRTDDCYNGSCGDEISPICVKRVPTDFDLLEVTIPIWLMIDQDVRNRVDPKPLDPNDLSIYRRDVHLFRKYVDGRNAIRVMRSSGRFSCGCGNQADDTCFICETDTACIVDSNYGIIRMDLNKDRCNCGCDRCAERLCIRYVSGECNGRWDRWVARLAASIINRDVCCDATGSLVKYWAQEFIQTDSRGRITSPLSAGEAANPFGTRRAGVEINRQLRGKRRRKIVMI